ncbi:MAG: hypothetical protein GPI98_09215 [Microcystis aeruginosa W13-13]|nr:hypothetical protein [Microcystis aeruginosa W13-13]
MSTEQQARALMMRHHHAVKNRQQSMLERSASEIGIDNDNGYGETVQRRFSADFSSQTYDRSGVTLVLILHVRSL